MKINWNYIARSFTFFLMVLFLSWITTISGLYLAGVRDYLSIAMAILTTAFLTPFVWLLLMVFAFHRIYS